MTTAQICEQCGAPMENRRKCGHCRTVYYIGPDVSPPVDPWGMSWNSSSSCMVMSTYASHADIPFNSPYNTVVVFK